jgi:hypothetical protein
LLVIYDDGQFAHINARDGQIQNPTMSHDKIKKLEILYINESETGAYISDTLRLDETQTEIEARMSIYHVMRPDSQAYQHHQQNPYHL